MTWIVGAPTIFGYGFGISDVRVTFGDGTERDCLQKVHQVGQFIAGGFAGSVRIGFAMLETLAALLHTDNKESAWDPKAVAEWWPQDARDIFVHSLRKSGKANVISCWCQRIRLRTVAMVQLRPVHTFTYSSRRTFSQLKRSGESYFTLDVANMLNLAVMRLKLCQMTTNSSRR